MLLPFMSLPVASLGSTVIYAFNTSDWFGKSVVIILVAGSIFAWSLMLTKWKEISTGRSQSRLFLGAYRREGHPLALLFQKRAFGGPLFAIYQAVGRALDTELGSRRDPSDLFVTRSAATVRVRLSRADINLAREMTERTTADETYAMEQHMGLLATAVTGAPFLGLLGTVWGVMDAFKAMAVTGSVMLSEVAPGISGALLTTVVGLLVALPSLIGYNLLSSEIRRMSVAMENFSDELVKDLERHFLRPEEG